MELLERDVQVARGIACFGAMLTSQIDEIYFYENQSDTPRIRALRRLVDGGTLVRVPFRYPESTRGGSPMGCYQLTRQGWKYFHNRPYSERVGQMNILHTLKAVDVHISMLQATRAGHIDLLHYDVEYDAWMNVAGAELHPDEFVEVGLRAKRQKASIWLEVDRASEGRKQLIGKIKRYVHARKHAEDYPLEVFPSVLFLVPTPEDLKVMRRIISEVEGTEGFIAAELISDFPAILLR
ncbi:replication-relaxation family protein [Nocardia sp. NPDC055165]